MNIVNCTFQTRSYRYNLLNNLMGPLNHVNKALREKKDLLQKHDRNLIGKKFRSHILEDSKTRKTTIEAFSAEKSKSESSKRDPFPMPCSINISKGGELRGIRFS